MYPRTPGVARHTFLGLFTKSPEELEQSLEWHRHRAKFDSVPEFRRRFRRRLFNEINRAGLRRLLLSDEELWLSSNQAVGRLRRFTARFAERVTVVAYLRRQDELLISRYQQAVRAGEVRRLRDWAPREPKYQYDFRINLNRYRTILEPAAMIVRRFERESFVDGSLEQDFLSAVGVAIRAADMSPVGPQNPSLDVEMVEFLRLLNIVQLREGLPRMEIDNRRLVKRLWDEPRGPTITLPDHVLDRFMNRWRDANAEVARDFLGDSSGELFRAPRKVQDSTTEQRLDPARVDHYFELLELPERLHAPLSAVAKSEAARARRSWLGRWYARSRSG
jgi:hypothetical protein